MQRLLNARSWKFQEVPFGLGGLSSLFGGLGGLFGFGGGSSSSSNSTNDNSNMLQGGVSQNVTGTPLNTLNLGSQLANTAANAKSGGGLFGGASSSSASANTNQNENVAQSNPFNNQNMYNFSLGLGSTFQPVGASVNFPNFDLVGKQFVPQSLGGTTNPTVATGNNALDTFAAMSRGGPSGGLPFLGALPAPQQQGAPPQVSSGNGTSLQGGVAQNQPAQGGPAPSGTFPGNIPNLQAANPVSAPNVLANAPQGNQPIWAQLANPARAQNNVGPAARAPIPAQVQRGRVVKPSAGGGNGLIPPPPPDTPSMLAPPTAGKYDGSPSSIADDLVPELKAEEPKSDSEDLLNGIKNPSKEMQDFADRRKRAEENLIKDIPDNRKEIGAKLKDAEDHHQKLNEMIDKDEALSPAVEADIAQKAREAYRRNNPKPEAPAREKRGVGQRVADFLVIAGAGNAAPEAALALRRERAVGAKLGNAEYALEVKDWFAGQQNAVNKALDAAKTNLPLKAKMAEETVKNLQKDAAVADKDYQLAINQAKRSVNQDMIREAHSLDTNLRENRLTNNAAALEKHRAFLRNLDDRKLKLESERNEISQTKNQISQGQLNVSIDRETRENIMAPGLMKEREAKAEASHAYAQSVGGDLNSFEANLRKRGVSEDKIKQIMQLGASE